VRSRCGFEQALLARYIPLGSSNCPLFGRKFGYSALESMERLALEYLTPAQKDVIKF
jgi:hypothetical protein